MIVKIAFGVVRLKISRRSRSLTHFRSGRLPALSTFAWPWLDRPRSAVRCCPNSKLRPVHSTWQRPTDDQRSNFASPQLTTSARKAITYSHIFDADNPHTGSPGYGIWDRHSWRPPTTMPQSVRDLCYAAISPSFGFHVQPSVPLSLTLSNGIHSFLHHSSCVAELLTANGVTLLSLVYHWCPAID